MHLSQTGYIKFVIILLILPLLALVFLKPPLTPNPKVDYGSCSGSLAANKSFRFNFESNAQSSGIYSTNGIDISATKTQSAQNYGIVQFDNTIEGIKLLGNTDPSTFKCGNNSCRFINLDPGGPNKDTPYQQINNQVFRLFKENNLVPKAEFPWHLGWVGQINLPDEPSKKRNVWMVLSDCHGNSPRNVTASLCALGKDGSGNIQPDNPNYDANKIPSAAGWFDPAITNSTQPAFFLLYVQKDTPTIYGDNFLNFDLYYKVGNNGELDLSKDLPKFIQNFCKNSEPITPLSIVQTGPQSYNPPKILNLSDPNIGTYTKFPPKTPPMECPGEVGSAYPELNKKYKLMLYTKFGGTTTTVQGVNSTANPQKAFCGEFKLIENSKYYVGLVSFAKFITLTDSSLTYTYYYLPDNSTPNSPNASTSPLPNRNLQLTTFNLDQVQPWGWWIPECKPAIYLYPQKTQQVSVKVTPKGYLTYTDPVYPTDGWKVTADPDGTIYSNQKTYPYLYYESKIRDEWIDKPLTGYVTKWQDLSTDLSKILPRLGLNSRETTDFIDYWIKALHYAPYYYMGVLTEDAINKIEPLEVSPTPDSTIRVRIYFKPLDQPIEIPAPNLALPSPRQGFSLVEWGGLVKNDLNHPFTCSQ